MKLLKTITTRLLLALAFTIPIFLISCGDDDENLNISPGIEIISDQFDANNNYTGNVDDLVSFKVKVSAPNGLVSLTANLFIDGSQAETLLDEQGTAGSLSQEFTSNDIEFKLKPEYINQSLVIIVTASDNNDNKVESTLNISASLTGVFILNEGNFGSGNSSVSYFNFITESTSDNLFSSANSTPLGDVAQSIHVYDDKNFIIVNNSNKVEAVNATDFRTAYTITAALPRFMATYEGKGYLTEWVSFSESGRVSVINLSTGASEATIVTGSGAENIIEVNGKLYVSNNFQSDVSVIDPSTNTVSSTIDVTSAPGGFVLDKNGSLWVICGGTWGGNDGAFYKINTADNSVSSNVNLEANASIKIAINNAKDAIYYMIGNEVFKLGIEASSKPSSAFITESSAVSFYGIGVNPSNDQIFVGDSKGFQANGAVYRYNSDGTAIDNFSVGVGPNGFAFR